MSKVTRAAAMILLAAAMDRAVLADPYQLNAEQNQMNGGGESNSYGAPKAVPMPAATPAPPVHRAPLKGAASQQSPRQPLQGQATQAPPMKMQIQTSVALPAGFLGAWAVQGQRQKVEAQPEFQAGAEQAFQVATMNTWNIAGSPQQGYSMSNGSISTQLVVDKVEGGTAFIRYQHPVGKTMAQEAIVMSLTPGGAQFNGLERISIVKEGLAQPRAKVTYQLMGQRQ